MRGIMGRPEIRVETRPVKMRMRWLRVGMQGVSVGMLGMWRIRVECENQGGNVVNQGGNAGNRGGNAGSQGENAGNRGGNARNQGDSLWESSCLLLRLKPRRGAFHHPGFMGRCPTISHTSFALSTKSKSSPLKKWGRGVSPRFHVLVFVFGVNQEN